MKVLGILSILFAFNSYADESFISRIHSVELDLVKFQNARVAISAIPLKLESLQGELVKVTISNENQLISLEKIEDLEIPNAINAPFVDEDYKPTVLANYSAAQKMLNSMRMDFLGETQSFNLAHIWAYEEFKKDRHFSQKAFIFFSDNFIRRHNHKWWFYVSPLVKFKNQQKVEEIILDKNLKNTPLTLAAWSAQLMGEKIHCPVVKKYSHTQSARDCAILKSNMYYWHPIDLQLLEQEQLFRVNFFDFELQTAFAASFGGQFLPQ